MNIRKRVYRILSHSAFIGLYQKLEPIVIRRMRKKNLNKTTKKVFQDIYSSGRWGGKKKEYHSGPGSRGSESRDYIAFLNTFIANLDMDSIRLVDLGCGDFRVGSELLSSKVEYVGVDIVPELIERNNNEYSTSRVKFVCLDIISDELPDGDICIIRQVLQHLSNDQIQKILKGLSKYKYVFVTEHHPFYNENFIPNKDKPHGPDIRLYDNSAVCLDKPPFNLVNVREVLTTNHSDHWGKLVTFLIENTSKMPHSSTERSMDGCVCEG